MTPNTAMDNLEQLTDEQLLLRHREGQTAGFEQLINRYRQPLYHFLIRFTGNRAAADDLFQETFIQIHLSADTFDVSRKLKPWLFTIAANKARDYLRKHKRQGTVPLSAPINSSDNDKSFIDLLEADLKLPEEQTEDKERNRQIAAAIDELPEHQREILLLSYFQNFAYNEIAEILDIPLGTVKSRLHAAVGNFANRWKSKNPDSAEA